MMLIVRIILIIFTSALLIVNLTLDESNKSKFAINVLCMLYLIYLLFG